MAPCRLVAAAMEMGENGQSWPMLHRQRRGGGEGATIYTQDCAWIKEECAGATHRAVLWIFIRAVCCRFSRGSRAKFLHEDLSRNKRPRFENWLGRRLRRLSHAEVELILSPFRFNLRDPMFVIPAESPRVQGTSQLRDKDAEINRD